MPFDYTSMNRKYEVLTGKPFKADSTRKFADIRKLPCITLHAITDSVDNFSEVRDWCEDNFGDNWIYEWDKFYFKDPNDALIFALRWYS